MGGWSSNPASGGALSVTGEELRDVMHGGFHAMGDRANHKAQATSRNLLWPHLAREPFKLLERLVQGPGLKTGHQVVDAHLLHPLDVV